MEAVEAEVRRKAFEVFLRVKSINGTARELNALGMATRRGGKWSDVQVARLLECPSAIGRYETKRSMVDGDGERVPVGAEEREAVECEPLVSREVWESAAALLSARRKGPEEVVDPIAGIVWCGCGVRMRHDATTAKFHCPGCRATLTDDDLEAVFGENFGTWVVAHPLWGRVLAPTPAEREAAGELLVLQAQIADLERQRAGVEEMFMQQAITKRRFDERLGPIEKALAEAKSRQRRLDEKIRDLGSSLPTTNTWLERWNSRPSTNRRKIMATFLQRIECERDELRFSYHNPEPSDPKDASRLQQISGSTNQAGDGRPVYIRLPKSGERCPHSGLTRSKLNELILPSERNAFRPPVESKCLRKRGSERGIRLISLQSLMDHLASGG